MSIGNTNSLGSDVRKRDRVSSATAHPQLYAKSAGGSDEMCDLSEDVVNGAVPQRQHNGQITVPLDPHSSGDAASKQYVDDGDRIIKLNLQLVSTPYTEPDNQPIHISSLPDNGTYLVYVSGRMVTIGSGFIWCALGSDEQGSDTQIMGTNNGFGCTGAGYVLVSNKSAYWRHERTEHSISSSSMFLYAHHAIRVRT